MAVAVAVAMEVSDECSKCGKGGEDPVGKCWYPIIGHGYLEIVIIFCISDCGISYCCVPMENCC